MKMYQNSDIHLKSVFLNGFNDFLRLLSSRIIPLNHLYELGILNYGLLYNIILHA